MGFLDSLMGSRQFNQNDTGLAADVAGRTGDKYVNGMSEADMYKLAMADKARKENDYRAAMEMVAKNQAYQADRKDAERFGDKVGPDGKYALVPAGDGRADWDAQIPGGDAPDPISIGLDKLQAYLINKPRNAANAYTDNVDPGLAAKWMADRAAFK